MRMSTAWPCTVLLLLIVTTVTPFDREQKQKMKRAVASLLDLDINDSPPPRTRMSNIASRYMKQLFEEASHTYGGVRGTVRSVAPVIDLRYGEEVFVFPLNTLRLGDRLIKAEFHVLGAKAAKAARILRPEALLFRGDHEGYPLKVSSIEPEGVRWNAVKPLLHTFANSSSLVIRLRRNDGRRPRPLTEFSRRHSPFLTVYTRNEEDEEMDPQEEEVEIRRRSKRNVPQGTNSGYFSYDTEDRQEHPLEEYANKGPSILNTRVNRKKFSRRQYEKMKAKQPFWGFGDKYAKEEKEVGDRLMKIGEEVGHQERQGNLGESLDSTTAVNDENGGNDVDVVLLNGEEEKHSVCSHRPLRVDFDEIGWSDWVIAPQMFEAGFCAGECPFPLPKEARASNHALVQAALSSGTGSSGLPAVCCAPDKMDSLTLLYYDQQRNVVLKSFPRMAVQSCGCI